MNAQSSQDVRESPSRGALARSLLVGSAAVLAALCALLASSAARADDELPPPPSPPPALAPTPVSPELEAEPSDVEDEAPTKPKPRETQAEAAALRAWSSATAPPSNWASRHQTPRSQEVWYGYQTLLVDGLFAGVLLIGVGTQTDEMVTTGGLGYVFGGPVVHWAHGEVGRGFGSFGFRLGLPLAGAILGSLVPSAGSGGESGAGSAGFGLGMTGAMVLDAALSFERVPVKEKKKKRQALELQPTLGWSPTTLSLGLAGTL